MYNSGTCFQTTNESSTKPFTKSHSILDRRFPLTYTYLQFILKARASHRVHWTTLLSTAPTFNALIWPMRNSYVPLYSWYVYKRGYSTSLFSSEAEPYYTQQPTGQASPAQQKRLLLVGMDLAGSFIRTVPLQNFPSCLVKSELLCFKNKNLIKNINWSINETYGGNMSAKHKPFTCTESKWLFG